MIGEHKMFPISFNVKKYGENCPRCNHDRWDSWMLLSDPPQYQRTCRQCQLIQRRSGIGEEWKELGEIEEIGNGGD